MELHSYALRSFPYKKLTIEQKRKLVENRIILDGMFNKKIFNIDESWLNLIKVCDLNGFDIEFIKKQWKNILIKYDHFLKRHNKTIQSLDDITRDLYTNEWEFFKKVHLWLKYKEQRKKNKHNKSIIPLEINNIGLKRNNADNDSSDTEAAAASDNNRSEAQILQSVSSSSLSTKNNSNLKMEHPMKGPKINSQDNKNENNIKNKFIKEKNSLNKLKKKKKLLKNKLEIYKLKFSILRIEKKLKNINNSINNITKKYPNLDFKNIQSSSSSSSSSDSSDLDSDSSSN